MTEPGVLLDVSPSSTAHPALGIASSPSLSSAAVLELAALAGVPIDDEAMALRIAVGAGAAVMAVVAAGAALQAVGALDDALLGGEAADHLSALESLAGDGTR
jgi:hypothetical protein